MDIDTKVTPSLHPDNLKAIKGYNEETAPHVALAVTAFSEAYERLRDVHRAREAADTNPTLNDAARLLQVAAFGEKHQNVITRKFDAAHAALSKSIAGIESMLSEPLKHKAERPGVAGEVRAHVKALSTEQRGAWFNERQQAGDLDSLEIVLGAPGYLSGLSDDERAVRTKFYHATKNPQVARRLDVLRAAQEMIETKGPLVFGEMTKAVGADSRKVARLREAKSAAEQAFILRSDNAV